MHGYAGACVRVPACMCTHSLVRVCVCGHALAPKHPGVVQAGKRRREREREIERGREREREREREGRERKQGGKEGKGRTSHFDVFFLTSDIQNKPHLLLCIRLCGYDEQPVQQIDGDPMWRGIIGPPDLSNPPISRHHQDGRHVILQGTIQVTEALDVQHVHLHHNNHHVRNHCVHNHIVLVAQGVDEPLAFNKTLVLRFNASLRKTGPSLPLKLPLHLTPTPRAVDLHDWDNGQKMGAMLLLYVMGGIRSRSCFAPHRRRGPLAQYILLMSVTGRVWSQGFGTNMNW
jgi:hypothetical protein